MRLWARLLTGVVDAIASGPRSAVALGRKSATLVRMTTGALTSPERALLALDARERGRLRRVGYAALSTGVAGAVAVAFATRSTREEAVVTGLSMLAWAAIRLMLLRTMASRSPHADQQLVRDAWALGLTPFALAWVDVTHAAAFLASAYITARGLGATLEQRKLAVGAAAVAFGAQAVVVAGAWLARSAVFFLMYLGQQG